MESYLSMKQKLEPLRLYNLSGTDEVSCELKAYAAGLDALFQMLSELEREFYIPTAQSFGLSIRERFLGREKPNLSTAERREALMYVEKSVIGDITDSGFAQFLSEIGVEDYNLSTSYTRGRVDITINDSKTDGEKSLIEKQIEAEIPAYMTLTVTFAE